jgi:hypothetical protein
MFPDDCRPGYWLGAPKLADLPRLFRLRVGLYCINLQLLYEYTHLRKAVKCYLILPAE